MGIRTRASKEEVKLQESSGIRWGTVLREIRVFGFSAKSSLEPAIT